MLSITRKLWLSVMLTLTACATPTPIAPSATPPPTALPPTALPLTAPPPTLAPTLAPTEAATAPPALPTASATPSTLYAPITEADWQDGPADARVTILVYSDFQCAYCALLDPALAEVRADFPDEVRVIYRHFPITTLHDKALLAAEAAEAAGAQGRFWGMHNALYIHQAAWTNLATAEFRAVLENYAAQLGLDTARFNADLDRGVHREKIAASYAEAVSIGLPGAPMIFFNGVVYQGPINHWALATLVKLELLKDRQAAVPPAQVIDPLKRYLATLHTTHGEVVLQLFADKAPYTVNNFVFLARAGWYDNITFHKVIPTYVVQTGDPSGTGYGGPGYFTPDEIVPEFTLDAAGWVGMANTGSGSNGSQFFITLAPIPELSGHYTVFGRVLSGLEVLNALTPRDPETHPDLPPGDMLLSVTIEEQ